MHSPPGLDHLTNFLFSHRLPLSLELNRDTFQAVMNAPHRPLVVLGAQGDQLRDVARGWRDRKSSSGPIFLETYVTFH